MSRTKRKKSSVTTVPKKKETTVNTKSPISYSLAKDITKDKSPECKRNSYGDVVYSMQYIGNEKFEYWIEYDEDRRPLSYRDSRGNSWNCYYNSKGNISYFLDSSGYEEEYKYYARNLVICTTSLGNKIKKKVEYTSFLSRDGFIRSCNYYQK